MEDDSSAMNLYCNRLEQAGFRTVAAMEAQEAFEALTQASADLIILDLLLPKPGGIELLKAIRSHSRHRETAVLVLSNAYLPEMAQEALKVGANKALPRSECTPAKLLSVVCELVGIAEARGNDPPGAAEGLDANDLAGQLESDLMEQGRAEVAAIQQHYSRFVEHAGSDAAAEHLGQVYQSVRLLTTRAGLAGCGRIGQLTAAIEAVLFECVFRSNGAMSASSMRVLGEAVDCLGGLFTSGDTGSAEYSPFPDGAETMLRGSDDLAAEPFSPLELAVKDTVLLLRTSPIQVPSESQGQMAAPSKPMGGLGKQHTIQLAVEEKHKYLRQALAEETKRREAVDQHAAENAKRRTELETAIEENQRSQQWFQQLLEGSQPQALASEEGGQAGQLNSSGRRRALMAVQNFVADKLIRLKEALTEETKRRETVEQEIAENANRRTELEAALAENQRVQGILQREADTVANHQPLIELESALTASEQSRKNLEGELAAARRKLAALKGGQATAESELESWAVELHVSQAGLEQKVQMLAEALRVEASRRESAEQQVRE
ncbi:MAG: response regulator, partial [Verrucomicrobia bacterium]|nr:response regulator [Verrucomicrobiota bacterium]